MDTGVYIIENLANGRRYVGSANSLKKRFREHRRQLSEGRHHSRFLQRAWNKYGPIFFRFYVVAYCDRENLIFYEQSLIDGLRPDYNTSPTAGSQLGYRHSEETRKKLREARARNRFSPMKGRKHTPEAIKKISENRKGKSSGEMTPDRRAKIGEANKGRVITPEQRAKISLSLTGLKQTRETIEKRRAKLIGRKMPDGFAEAASKRMTGYICSPEHRLNNAKTKAKLTDDQVREIRRLSLMCVKQKELAEQFKIDPSSISEIVNRKSYRWVE